MLPLFDAVWGALTPAERARLLALLISCPDADGDGSVTFADLEIVLDAWGTTVPAGTAGDVTGDGLVDFADLNGVLDRWGEGCME